MLASRRGSLQVTKMLLDYGADPNLANSVSGQNTLSSLAHAQALLYSVYTNSCSQHVYYIVVKTYVHGYTTVKLQVVIIKCIKKFRKMSVHCRLLSMKDALLFRCY